jgi:cell division protein FtsW
LSVAIRRNIDMTLLLVVLLLVAIGIGMVFSASFVTAHKYFGDGTYFLVRHIAWVAIGLVVLLVIARLDYHLWQRIATPLYVVTVVLLALVMVPGLGTSTYGASRWLALGPLPSFQPSELVKLAVIIYLASWITRVGGNVQKLTLGTIPFAIILSVSAGLVLIEPDLGTTIVLVLTAASVFFVSGANLLHGLLGAAIGCFLLINLVTNTGYKADRIEAWLDPWADPGGIGWHTTQTLTALGSGGFAGLGLGEGRKKFDYLPNAHTDSIFAVVGEEIGFLGTTLVLSLFLLFCWRGLTVALGAPDPLGRTLAAGATLLIGWQALLNMAVVSHVVPNTGVPLPLLSYGGSAMVTTLAAIGLILSVSRSVDPQLRSWRSLFTLSQGPWRPSRPSSPAPAAMSDEQPARRAPRRTATRRALRSGTLADAAQ